MHLEQLFRAKLERRQMLKDLGLLGASAALVAALPRAAAQAGNLDAEILNFALNLEYLEAEYYLRGAFGAGLDAADVGANPGPVTGGAAVPFDTPAFREYAEEIARDEEAHVRFIRSALGAAAVARPAINFTDAFNAAAQAAGLGESFDPFADEVSFIIGAFVFEDVGVTAYNGAAPFITDQNGVLPAAAGILAVEAYHAGEVRTLLFGIGGDAVEAANAISDLRAAAGGGKDQGLTLEGRANIVPTDDNALAFARTPREVANIVFLDTTGTASAGGFFPEGLSGDFSNILAL